MFDRDKWLEILSTMIQHPLRTILTSVSVAVGIFILVILTGLTNGFEHGVKESMGDDATNSIWVRSNRTALAYKGFRSNRRIEYELEDHDYAASNIDNVGVTSARLAFWSTSVKWGKEVSNYGVRCVHPGHQQVERTKVSTGRYISQGDVDRMAKVAVVGKDVAEGLFGKTDPIGELIQVKGVTFKVVGTFDDGAGRWENRQIYLPITTGQNLFAKGSSAINMFIVGTGESTFEESEGIVNTLDGFLRTKYSVHPEDRQGVRLRNVNEEGKMIENVFLGIRIFGIFLAIMTLFIAVIGVSNIMSIVVRERTREFGVRKAMGATPWDVVSLILQESIFMTLISGLLGVIMGTGLLFGVAGMIEDPLLQNPRVSLNLVLIALVALVVCGGLSGAIPAYRAARLKPVDALKDE
jgi:putative ABC transport system permease protein